MTDREDAIFLLYEAERCVSPLIRVLHHNETLFLSWEDYLGVMEQCLGALRELEAEGVTVVEEPAPTAVELDELKRWLEGVGK